VPEEIYFIPQETEIDALITMAGTTLAPLLQLLKETGIRIGEAEAMQWKDIDFNNKTVSINHPEKGSLPRIIPISERLLLMINTLPKTEKPVFLSRNKDKESIRKNFEKLRKRASTKLANPRIMQIHLHTFRHFKATMMFLEHRDQYEVRKLLGHKTSTMTDKYINITETLLKNKEEKYTVKAVKTMEEAITLIEDGFEHHDDIDGMHIYRKRK
jgi:integrase